MRFRWGCSMCWRFDALRRLGRSCAVGLMRASRGQATLEAALLIPVVLLGMLAAIEPGIVLYDRIVMQAASAECCRVLATLPAGKEEQAQDYVLRRLGAIPEVDVFHVGEWTVELVGDESSDETSVSLTHRLRALPLISAGMQVLGAAGPEGTFEQTVACTHSVRDQWVMDSEYGSDADAWIERWDQKA